MQLKKQNQSTITKEEWYEILEKGMAKVAKMEEKLTAFPHTTKNGEWLVHENGHWTGGFWVGLLWIEAILNGDKDFTSNTALAWAKKFSARINDNKTHDQGFIFGPSCVLGFHLTNDKELFSLAQAGANNMKDLYEERSGFILAWDEPGYEGVSIVDTIMNLPLMFWIASKSNDPEFHRIAEDVAKSIIQHHIREDSSVYHAVRWDTTDFNVVDRYTHQGFSKETCWSRGQAWAAYGFANLYRYTKEPRYLEMSMNVAEYFWNHLDDETNLPRWDFIFKNKEEEPYDASAGSIAASGMLLLSDLLKRDNKNGLAQMWKERAELILNGLVKHCMYSDIEKYGIVEKATVDKPRNSGINESTMYGDYYFIEAIFRLINEDNKVLLDLLY
ncbi:glycoside hydrolase family 88 protein [Bacillus sp. FJAT-50079]|uniref:glycoside hydrolase family 88 protein n=1 Tax=Bacillus sp. FJAT-50079 TaxID=2833577 RepID=UPI001BC8FAAD|nr:glycoside hydrolase family 88 protein [Bacillus sp. FJAT-50079]MBS4207530.1 glycoside hydrolase family 88 protein [Bacillus sp. FJAT-50079]